MKYNTILRVFSSRADYFKYATFSELISIQIDLNNLLYKKALFIWSILSLVGLSVVTYSRSKIPEDYKTMSYRWSILRPSRIAALGG